MSDDCALPRLQTEFGECFSAAKWLRSAAILGQGLDYSLEGRPPTTSAPPRRREAWVLGPGFPREELDFRARYMTAWLRMIGVADIVHVEVEKTLMGPEAASREAARAEAARLARTM